MIFAFMQGDKFASSTENHISVYKHFEFHGELKSK